jgi:hypothetical protein
VTSLDRAYLELIDFHDELMVQETTSGWKMMMAMVDESLHRY